jgi:AcrR family transcriptional regulator
VGTRPGLRERKKQKMRALIAEAAWTLFRERGFDNVTVAEVAGEADVAAATVFNHFPTKEDLVYQRMEAFEDAMLQAVRDRPASESIIAAFARFVLAFGGLLGSNDEQAAEEHAAITRVITDSPRLLARERELFERYTRTLAELIAKDTKRADDIEPWVAANALIGVHRALLGYVRREVLAGKRNPRLTRDARAQGTRAFALLERGLGHHSADP